METLPGPNLAARSGLWEAACNVKWKLGRQIRPVGVPLPNSVKTAAINGNAAWAKLGNYRGLQEAAGLPVGVSLPNLETAKLLAAARNY